MAYAFGIGKSDSYENHIGGQQGGRGHAWRGSAPPVLTGRRKIPVRGPLVRAIYAEKWRRRSLPGVWGALSGPHMSRGIVAALYYDDVARIEYAAML